LIFLPACNFARRPLRRQLIFSASSQISQKAAEIKGMYLFCRVVGVEFLHCSGGASRPLESDQGKSSPCHDLSSIKHSKKFSNAFSCPRRPPANVTYKNVSMQKRPHIKMPMLQNCREKGTPPAPRLTVHRTIFFKSHLLTFGNLIFYFGVIFVLTIGILFCGIISFSKRDKLLS